MKKIITGALLVGGIVLFAAACNKQAPTAPAHSTTPSAPSQPTTTPTVPTAPPTAMQTYTNSSYNFSFEYPSNFTFVTPTYGTLQNQIVQVQMGNSAYPKTNFDDADFTVSQDFAKTQADCLNLPQSGSTPKYTDQTIDGITMYLDTNNTGGAGAGNFYNTKSYVTYHGTDCIAIAETIHTGDIGNYPAGITEVNQAPIQAQLDQILNSFKFTN